MVEVFIADKSHAEYNVRFHSREMDFWRECIAKEENKPHPNFKKIEKLNSFYEKNWNVYIQSKMYIQSLYL